MNTIFFSYVCVCVFYHVFHTLLTARCALSKVCWRLSAGAHFLYICTTLFVFVFVFVFVFLLLLLVNLCRYCSFHQRFDQLFHARRRPVRSELAQLIHFLLIAVVTQIRAFQDFTFQPLHTRSLTFAVNTNFIRQQRVFFHPTVPA